jgi:hypothetical protein
MATPFDFLLMMMGASFAWAGIVALLSVAPDSDFGKFAILMGMCFSWAGFARTVRAYLTV